MIPRTFNEPADLRYRQPAEGRALIVDGAIELIRHPDSRRGWSPDQIEVTVDRTKWPLSGSAQQALEVWQRAHPTERSDPKLAVRSFATITNGERIRCVLQATDWKDVMAAQERVVSADEHAWLTELPLRPAFPNIAVVHVVVVTADRRVLLGQRSAKVHFHPSQWTASFEEGLALEDAAHGGAIFHAAALRGAAEELTPIASTKKKANLQW
jgi:hypothetical protein